ncbi:hypothetical protein FACS189413_09630 [Bacteroidia bacterium]|nr:hypothetical protein FACS189463_1300 [Bacteroidia bacterium]GHU69956.1 hypothetical protein FACS189413_09630 [Bacteroidia bacterium]
MTNTQKQLFGSKQETDKEVIEYTAKGNRIYHFKTITKEELEKVRIPTYSYLL